MLTLNSLNDPVKCKDEALTELGYQLSAGILNSDSEILKRIKIAKAIASHKLRSTFAYDVKIKIDLIALGDSVIYRAIDEDDWILCTDGTGPSVYYWSAMGCDGIDDDLGISLIGSGLEVEVAGNIYIDVDNAALSAADQARIALDIADSVPAYFKVHIGYENVGGQFIEYFCMG